MFLPKTNRIEVDRTVEFILDPNAFPNIDEVGTERWYDDEGELHRENGPAIVHFHGRKAWFIHGIRHREDGPAVDDGIIQRYWINGEVLTKSEWEEYVSSKNK